MRKTFNVAPFKFLVATGGRFRKLNQPQFIEHDNETVHYDYFSCAVAGITKGINHEGNLFSLSKYLCDTGKLR